MNKVHKVALQEFRLNIMHEFPTFKFIESEKENEVLLEEKCLGNLRLRLKARTVRSAHGDRMTVECIWVTRASGFLPTQEFSLPYQDETQDGIRFRLAYFWKRPGSVDLTWWQLSSEPSFNQNVKNLLKTGKTTKDEAVNTELIDKSIKDIVAKIKKYAVPYFEKVKLVTNNGLSIDKAKVPLSKD